jgi:hypothetical protein
MSIPLKSVCLDRTKLSLKSSLAEVNIVRRHRGHGQCLGGRKDETRGQGKGMIAAKAELKKFSDAQAHTFYGIRPVCHRLVCHRLVYRLVCHRLVVTALSRGDLW